MSLQEIEKSHIISGTEGLEREIDASSKKMMMDILQVTQYSKPIDSTVRELASNAVDSQKEKEIAVQILKGELRAEDFYIERDGEQYKDSRFDASYYSLDHLDTENNVVKLYYEEGEGSGFTDKFIVEDRGVGLGMPRLAGYFKLGFSTKRNTKHALGAFGLGAKAALSTNVPYYTMETVHNGKLFRFNCYAYKVESTIPPLNMAKKVQNPRLNIAAEGADPYYVHYEETDSKNYTKIITGVKRHNRQHFIRAVKNQLLYFKGVEFYYKYEDSEWEEKPFLANVLHNSETLLVSDTNLYSKPHVVIVKEKGSSFGVTYGTIDFQELEMEQRYGSIGFKCPIRSVVEDPKTGERVTLQEGVSVTPRKI